jgi:hypothetical protein
MLFFGVGGAGGLSMQARRAASTLAHPAVLKPADAQHAIPDSNVSDALGDAGSFIDSVAYRGRGS